MCVARPGEEVGGPGGWCGCLLWILIFLAIAIVLVGVYKTNTHKAAETTQSKED